MNLVIVVDPQVDFIEGSLKVKGASGAINNLCKFLEEKKDDLEAFVTLDWHPHNHCSFEEFGGEWPIHCVQRTIGAAMAVQLANTLHGNNIGYQTVTKGEIEDEEQYSFLDGREHLMSGFVNIVKCSYDTVYLSGLAGDFCVLETLKGLEPIWDKVVVLKDCIASIDEGVKLEAFCKENNIRYE